MINTAEIQHTNTERKTMKIQVTMFGSPPSFKLETDVVPVGDIVLADAAVVTRTVVIETVVLDPVVRTAVVMGAVVILVLV